MREGRRVRVSVWALPAAETGSEQERIDVRSREGPPPAHSLIFLFDCECVSLNWLWVRASSQANLIIEPPANFL